MNTRTTYFPSASIFVVCFLLFMWGSYIFAVILEIGNGIDRTDFMIGPIVLLFSVIVSVTLYKGVYTYTSRKVELTEKSVTIKGKGGSQHVDWKDVVYFAEKRAPNYLYGSSDGYIVQYIKDGSIETIHLIATKKIVQHIQFLDENEIIKLDFN